MKTPQFETLTLEKIVGGGQALGTLSDGRKAFVWGGLPGETVTIRLTKKKTHFVEGVVSEIHTPSSERVTPEDPKSYLSTSPWQIMSFDAEQHYKAALIEEAFELHDIVLPNVISLYTDNHPYHYRNKVEFSWFGSDAEQRSETDFSETAARRASVEPASAVTRAVDVSENPVTVRSEPRDGSVASFDEGSADAEARQDKKQMATGRPETKEGTETGGSMYNHLDLAFHQRGSKGKIIVDSCALLPDHIMRLAIAIRDLLNTKRVAARDLKTLLIRSDQQGNCVWQLYVKAKLTSVISPDEAKRLPARGGEIIYSDPRSPASRITERLASFGDIVLTDTILGVPFHYATESFFQVNIPVYEQALHDMRQWVDEYSPLLPPPSSSTSIGSSSHSFPERLRSGSQIEPTSLETRAVDVPERNRTQPAVSPADSLAVQDDKLRASDSTPFGEDFALAKADQDKKQLAVGRSETKVSDGMSGTGPTQKVIDLYSGVGTIGLTIGGPNCTLVEIDEHAVREMKRNITDLRSSAHAVLAPSEKALDYITSDSLVIVDPPRAGLHADVIARLLETRPERIIYLSCNPVTQARDVSMLAEIYGIRAHQGYNFFPRTPHIEHLVILDKIKK